jgi:hypothetical protein
MRPTPIPADEVWEGARRVVVGPPGNDLDSDVASVEVLLDQSTIGPRMSARCVLEDDDLDLLTAGGTVWVSFYGGSLVPFSVDVQPPLVVTPYLRMEVDLTDGVPDFRAFLGGVPEGMDPADFAEGCAEALTAMATEWRTAEAGEG